MIDIDYTCIGSFGASAEWVHSEIGFIRGGADWIWGDPYQFTCMVIVTGKTAEIKGFLGLYNKTIRSIIKTLLKNKGITKIVYERRNQRNTRIKSITIEER